MFSKVVRVLVSSILLIAFGYVAGASGVDERVTAQSDVMMLTEQEALFSELYNRVSRSIVSISISEPFGGEYEEVSGGSGFVIDNQGRIVTNFHVIDTVSRQGRVEVNFIDGTIVQAEVIGEDPDSDIAVIRVDVPEERLFPLTFADSDQVVIGQTTLALGSPFGQKWTMTTGIISALDRAIDGLGNYQIGAAIQTDAAINPGNSGGPLLNLRGEVLGVNAQIISEQRVNSGIGFAVPGNLVQRVANELIADGRVSYAYMGVNGEDISLNVIDRLSLPNDTQGVWVKGFGESGVSPAEANGVQIDDVITAVDGQPITSFGTLIAYLSTKAAPDETVKVTVLRNEQIINLDVTLGQR